MDKVYLGDGLYAEIQGHQIAVTSENGIAVLETVYFEPETLKALLSYALSMGWPVL